MIVQILATLVFGLSCYMSGMLSTKWAYKRRDYTPLEGTFEILTAQRDDYEIRLEHACDRIFDMLLADDGQAWSEAERFLKREQPGLYNRLGLSHYEPPTLRDRACGFIVGLFQKGPKQ